MLKQIIALIITISSFLVSAQTWQDVGGGTNNSSHGMLTWNGKLINLGSYNNPCNRVSEWDGANWSCLGPGVGIVARAGVVWDGKLVVVGDFWNNFQPCVGCNGVAVWDGTSWTPLGTGVNNDVLTCTVWNNELVIGGDFTEADGVPCARIIKWNGTAWESVGPIGVFDNDIRCMTEFQGELWVGGDFNNVGGTGSHDGLVKYDEVAADWTGGNSGVDLVGGVNESVRVLYVNPNDGNLYMGGEFPELIDGDVGVQDFNMAGIAMYDGSNWFPLGTGLQDGTGLVPEPYCRAMHEYNGDMVIGGYFTSAGGTPANKIAKWDGTNWTAMGLGFDGVGVDEYVKSATVWNGIFFAGGAYTQAEGNPMNYIAQWYEPPSAAPVAWMTSSSTSLCGSGCIDFLDNSTNAPTSWNWTFPGSDTPTSSAQDPGSVCWSNPGTYTVSLQACNSIGCTTQNIDIEVESGATVSVNDASICGGGPATLTANPSVSGGTFLWSPGGETTGSISVNPGSTTTYDVTYSYLGCTSSATSTVTVGTGPSVGLTASTSICEGQSTTLTATPSVGGGTYLWTPTGETTASITISPMVTTTYSVEYTLNGCASPIETSTVTVGPAYNITNNITTCEGTTITYPDGITETITSNATHTSNLTSSIGCDSVIVTNVTMESAYSESESIDICTGLNYTYPDGTVSNNITSNESHISSLVTVNGCDSTITTNILVQSTYTLSESQDVCTGSNYTYPDGTVSNNITANESHVSSLSTANGCDSTITTNINVVTAYNEVQNLNLCAGSSYTYPDGTTSNNIMTDESHVSTLISSNGCDSIITSNLTIAPDYNLVDQVNVCSGSNYTYPDGTISTNITSIESHISNLISVAGCDSIITSNLSINPIYNINEPISVCPNTTVTYPDGSSETITANTSHTSNLTSTDGCDSTIITSVSVGAIYNFTDNQDVCTGANYTYPDGTTSTNVTANESHVSSLLTVIGCDSTITTNLTVVSAYNETQNLTVCSGSSYIYPDGTTSTGIVTDESHVSSLISTTGCDSIITSNLAVLPTYNLNENMSVCSGTIVNYPDGTTETITANSSHTSALTTSSGCDSIIVTNVTMNEVYDFTENITVCAGDDYTYPDGTLATNIQTNESHTSSFTSAVGCDSTYVTNITVSSTIDNTVNEVNNVITANQSGATYQWIDCDNGNTPITGENGQSYTPMSNGNYAVEITIGSCSDISSCTAITTIGIEEIVLGSQFKIYPNPVEDFIELATDLDIDEFKYRIIDSRGRTLTTGKGKKGQKIHLFYALPGMYILEINDGELGRYRFVKK